MNCSDNYDGSNAIGNGEVDSSILSGSTIFRSALAACRLPAFHPFASSSGCEMIIENFLGPLC